MSGFDKHWLALREPADRLARSRPLIGTLCRHLAEARQAPFLLDIGCGTGSTYRTLSPLLPAETRWLLLDYDPQLLLEAERQIPSSDWISFRQHDLNDLASLPLDGVSVVTASALFDLCSASFTDRFVERLAYQETGLYAALNYDGVMEWSISHPLDRQVVDSFNRHQGLDKGFGPALGPNATHQLSQSLSAKGYRVETGPSPWHLGSAQHELQADLLRGIHTAVAEIGAIAPSELDDWVAYRLDVVADEQCLCVVGHADLLAIHDR